MVKTTAFPLACLVLSCISVDPSAEPVAPGRQAATAQQKPPLRVVEGFDALLRARTYSIDAGPCRLSWEVLDSEPNLGVIRHRSACVTAWPAQMEAVAAIAAAVFAAEPPVRLPATLSWGRLSPDGAVDPPMAVRLSLAAARSPSWDMAAGKPKGGDLNGFTRDLCNRAVVYSELRDHLGELGLSVSVSSVEKVLVVNAGRLPFFEELRRNGVTAGDRVPYDCQTWFRISRR